MTFAVGLAYVMKRGVPYEEYMPLFVALLEVPSIVVGMLLARLQSLKTVQWGPLAHEIFLGKSVVLLVGGLFIGWAAGPTGLDPMRGLFFDLFKGVLALFLLEVGLVTASRVGDLKRAGLFLIAFAVLVPLLFAVIGAVLGKVIVLSLGGTTLLAVLAASASYIAAPAAVRIAIPEANPTLSIGAALAITFPFYFTIGIPLYYQLSLLLHK